ncbi:MAG: IS21 family transposase, partial [Elusimicrobiota bacterium]|nr:IS21 family transposase [Elusimicrobiota bacterium]
MNAQTWAEARRLKVVEKQTVSEISRRLGIDRKTVRRALSSEVFPGRAPCPGKPSKLDAYKPYIYDRLKEYPKLSATRILEEIKPQGYAGKMRIVWEYVAGLRARQKEAFLRIETQPGEFAQVDWAHCGTVQIGTAQRKLSCFVMVLSHSRMMYAELTVSQCIEDFIRCHINAFHYFGGTTRKLLYDNLKTVVLSRLGRDVRFNPAFMEFAGTYLFEPVACNPSRG